MLVIIGSECCEYCEGALAPFNPQGQQAESPESLRAKEVKRNAITEANKLKESRDKAEAQRQATLAWQRWRIVDGVTNDVKGTDWYHFTGIVSRKQPGGIMVNGLVMKLADETPDMVVAFFGEIPSAIPSFDRSYLPSHLPDIHIQQFFVANFPYTNVMVNEKLEPKHYYMAKFMGLVETNGIEIRKYDYGTASALPPPEVVAKEAAKEKEKNAGKLKLWQEKAAEGKDLYQFFLGKYYVTNSVEKDLAKAREWFQKAADQGNADAAAELRKLPLQTAAAPVSAQTNSPAKAE